MGQFCDSVNGESHSMPVEERNELNTQALQDIYGSIDLLTEAVNSSDNGSYLHEIKISIDNLAEQTSELNKSLLYLTQIIK